MPLLADLIDIPESVQRDDFVLKLTAGVADEAAAQTLGSYVVTPELAGKFDEALGFIRAALETGTSKSAFLHGSFGSGKSHFMAVLHRILQGDPAARGLPRLAHVIPKHAGWMAGKRFLLVPYNMMGKRDVTSAILGGYADFVRAHHPQAPLPGVYLGDSLLDDAKRLRSQMGDEAFFRNLAACGAAGGWGDFDASWDAAAFDRAVAAAAGSDERARLVSDLVATYFTSYGTQTEGRVEAFLELDKGLQVIARHARSLGYDAAVLFLDELVLWLASQAANPAFVHGEVQKLVNLVESQESRREIPIVGFVARQRELADLLDTALPGAQQLRFSDAVRHWEERFGRITLEDRNLPAIAEERILKPKDDAARRTLDEAFRKSLPSRDEVRRVLQTADYDETQFRQVYPFTPALVSALVAVSSVLQRDRTAIRVLMQLLVAQRDTLEVGDLVPVGDLFDLIADGAQGFSPEMARHFDNATRLHTQKFLPLLEAKHGRIEHLLALPWKDPKRAAFRNDERLLKTLLLAALVPGEATLKSLTASRLMALNHGTIRSPIPGQEPQEVLRRCREWAGTCGEIVIGDRQDPTVAIQLSTVDTASILDAARSADTPGERIRRVRRIVYDNAGVQGEEELEQTIQIDWRNTPRRATVLFKNIRELPDSSLDNDADDWRLILDYPFDDPGHSPREDLTRLTSFRSSHQGGARTICWVPSFLGSRALEELGLLVRCEHVLGTNMPGGSPATKEARFREFSGHLSEQDRASALGLITNQRIQLESRVRAHVMAAYGLAEEQSGSLAPSDTVPRSDQFVSLRPQLGISPPAGPTFRAALADLLGQAFAFEYPAAPEFGAPVKLVDVKKVAEKLLEAVDAPDRRVYVEPPLRSLVRGIAGPLKLGVLGEDRDNFVLGDHWVTHFTQWIAREKPADLTVGKLRNWIDEPQRMGLPIELANLVTLLFARQTNRGFTRHGGPHAVEVGSLGSVPGDLILRAETLPSADAWQKATAFMQAALGITPAETASVRTVERAVKDAKAVATRHAASLKDYDARLAEALVRAGIDPRSSRRMQSVAGGRRLVEAVTDGLGASLVETIAGIDLPTGPQAVGTAIVQSARLAAATTAINWPLFDAVQGIAGPLGGDAAGIVGRLRTALDADEHAAPLRDAVDSFNRDAAAVLARALPPQPPPGVGHDRGSGDGPDRTRITPPAGRRVVHNESRENLRPAEARTLIAEIEKQAVGDRTVRIHVTWTLDEPDGPAFPR
jgi:hypothetical protein